MAVSRRAKRSTVCSLVTREWHALMPHQAVQSIVTRSWHPPAPWGFTP